MRELPRHPRRPSRSRSSCPPGVGSRGTSRSLRRAPDPPRSRREAALVAGGRPGPYGPGRAGDCPALPCACPVPPDRRHGARARRGRAQDGPGSSPSASTGRTSRLRAGPGVLPQPAGRAVRPSGRRRGVSAIRSPAPVPPRGPGSGLRHAPAHCAGRLRHAGPNPGCSTAALGTGVDSVRNRPSRRPLHVVGPDGWARPLPPDAPNRRPESTYPCRRPTDRRREKGPAMTPPRATAGARGIPDPTAEVLPSGPSRRTAPVRVSGTARGPAVRRPAVCGSGAS